MERGDPWARLIAVAGVAGSAVALVYVIGGLSLSLRYDGFGLPGQQAAAQTPREVLLAAGLRTLAVWMAVGIGLIVAIRGLPEAMIQTVATRLRSPLGCLSVAALAVALFLLVKVWWPLAALAGLIAIVLASARWDARSPQWLLTSALSVALVAVAYEADRLSYLVEWTCVRVAPPDGAVRGGAAGGAPAPVQSARVCGMLVGHQDRGFYLGVPGAPGRAKGEARPYRLVFVPAARVAEASSRKQLARVIADHAASRREPLRSRLWDVRVR